MQPTEKPWEVSVGRVFAQSCCICSHIEDFGREPLRPVGGKDLNEGSDDHKDLDSPQSGLPAEAIDGPVAHQKDDDESAGIHACTCQVIDVKLTQPRKTYHPRLRHAAR